jgi:plasmid stabilization system protein ParE
VTAIEFRPAAAADLEEAADWYEAKRSGLGLEFLDAVRATLATISENPKHYPVLHRDTRRALVQRFPYGLYYRIMAGRVLIVACMHGRRRPSRWKSRA